MVCQIETWEQKDCFTFANELDIRQKQKQISEAGVPEATKTRFQKTSDTLSEFVAEIKRGERKLNLTSICTSTKKLSE